MDASALEHLEAHLARNPGKAAPVASKRAAVAIALFLRDEKLAVQLMRRAERPGDPWSGQVSLPGGRAEPDDPDLIATAVREAREELGLDLSAGAKLLGRLDDRMAIAQGKLLPMSVTPVVFALQAPPAPTLQTSEVARAFSVRLADLGPPNDGIHPWSKGPVTLKLPCWRVDGEVIWGMTHRILSELLELFPRR